ncbi:MAG: DUF3021 family protein [Lachnospira sp.]|nr:DUF3021 family protein [Lachnospira sp.]
MNKAKSDNTMFDYLAQVFMVFGIAMMCLVVFSVVFGDAAKGYSTMFTLGKEGVSIETIVQYFLLIVVIITLRFLFFTDALIKKMSLTLRTVLMFTMTIVAIAAFIIMFGWFPATEWFAWVMFIVCFAVSAGISTFISALKEKADTQKMQQALERMKRENV